HNVTQRPQLGAFFVGVNDMPDIAELPCKITHRIDCKRFKRDTPYTGTTHAVGALRMAYIAFYRYLLFSGHGLQRSDP
ncbi:TPA: hypothetical protein ACPXR2_004467, partial [Klebsiella pneumoniae]